MQSTRTSSGSNSSAVCCSSSRALCDCEAAGVEGCCTGHCQCSLPEPVLTATVVAQCSAAWSRDGHDSGCDYEVYLYYYLYASLVCVGVHAKALASSLCLLSFHWCLCVLPGSCISNVLPSLKLLLTWCHWCCMLHRLAAVDMHVGVTHCG